MKIKNFEKEQSKKILQNISSTAKVLKKLKVLFFQLHRENNPSIIKSLSESVQQRFRQISQNLQMNERKVLNAYISYHLQSINLKISIAVNEYKGNENLFLRNSKQRKKEYENDLLHIFKKWFQTNFLMNDCPIIKNDFIPSQIAKTQQLLITLGDQVTQNKFSFSNKQKPNTTYCQITLVLILLTQLNLCAFLFIKRQFPTINSLIQKSKTVHQLLIKQNKARDQDIQRNLASMAVLHRRLQNQLKMVHLKYRKKSLKSIRILQKRQREMQKQQSRQNDQSEAIQGKYVKAIDQLAQKNRRILGEKVKLEHSLMHFKSRIAKYQNYYRFQCDEKHLGQTKIQIKFLNNQKLNKALNIFFDKQSSPNKASISDLIFQQQDESQKNIFLSVIQSRKNQQISIKDYFNFCLLIKRSVKNEQVVIYFEILVYQFKKKDIINQYCIKQPRVQYYDQQSEDSQKFIKDSSQNTWEKSLQRLVKNQQLMKILLFSLINLVQLYQQLNAFFWSMQTLKYIQQIIEHTILAHLRKIKISFVSPISDTQNQIINQEGHYSLQSIECQKLVQKYQKYLQEIKSKIIKNSMNTLLRNKQENIICDENRKQYKPVRYKTARKTARKTVLSISTAKIKKLEQKQSQLNSIINDIKWKNIKLYQTNTQTPNSSQETNFGKIRKYNINQILSTKGKVYQLKKKYPQIKKLNAKRIVQSNQRLEQGDQILRGNASIKQIQTKQTEPQLNFTLVPTDHPISQQTNSIKSIEQNVIIKKLNTLNFLQTSKSIQLSNKAGRMGEYRLKLLQKKSQLQEYIRLSFEKLSTMLKRPYISTISLNQINVENFDIILQIDELLGDFDELLASLKTFSLHCQESFQRQLLIQAKIRVLQIIKCKQRHQKTIQVTLCLLQDIKLLKNSERQIQLKKQLLWSLASNYFNINDYKNCLSRYLQLAKLGQYIGYMKMGEIYMIRKDYDNSIRYYEKYAAQKNYDLVSKVKLAHAYSKVPQYYMKNMDMLMGILLQVGNGSKFKTQIYERKCDDKLIESAVILLSSLYFKRQNLEKAIEICENYSKINIKNYRVLHVLGGYYRYQKDQRKSFQCYLNALQNNPSHHKSLLQLTQFICQGLQYKSHAIKLLRKCYCIQNRNYQLLKTLIKFLGEDPLSQDKRQQNNLDYTVLLKYADILKQSKTNGYSSCNFYQEASLVYEWALALLDKNISIANLDEVQKIYKNLGQICLKRGDYAKSQNYYKIYLVQLEKYLSQSNFNESFKCQKMSKTQMEIYYLLGKVKKEQKYYKKAIQYFQKSFQIQTKLKQKLKNLESYFCWFQVGHCHFMLQEYEKASIKFLQHKSYLLNFINYYDKYFYNQQRQICVTIPSFLDLRPRKRYIQQKINYLKIVKNSQNQTIQNFVVQNAEDDQIQHVFKKNYFENQIYIAFCYDKLKCFIESKEIYKKILQFFSQVQQVLEQRQKFKNSGRKMQLKNSESKYRESNLRHMTLNFKELNQQYKQLKKVCLINLANIYKIQGIQNKYTQMMQQYSQLCPQNIAKRSYHKVIQQDKSAQKQHNIFIRLKIKPQQDIIKNYKVSIKNIDQMQSFSSVQALNQLSDEVSQNG